MTLRSVLPVCVPLDIIAPVFISIRKSAPHNVARRPGTKKLINEPIYAELKGVDAALRFIVVHLTIWA